MAPLNLAVKQLVCPCGSKIFRFYPMGPVHYNTLNPLECQPTMVGQELECIDCGKFAALKQEQGKLASWMFQEGRSTRPTPAEKSGSLDDKPGKLELL